MHVSMRLMAAALVWAALGGTASAQVDFSGGIFKVLLFKTGRADSPADVPFSIVLV